MSFFCLGVRIDKVTKQEALSKVSAFLHSTAQYKIYTPNPEMLVEAHRSSGFRDILNRGDLNVCDGFGLSLVSKGSLQRIPGVEFMLSICELAEKEGKAVYFLGNGTTNKCIANFKIQFPNLRISGYSSGPIIEYSKTEIGITNKSIHEQTIDAINRANPDIVFVGFGHYKQEWWIDSFVEKMQSVKVAMGVGGSFDFVSGKAKRAPKIVQKIGLEWLWRLLKEPKRFIRIYRALIVFPFLCLKKYGNS